MVFEVASVDAIEKHVEIADLHTHKAEIEAAQMLILDANLHPSVLKVLYMQAVWLMHTVHKREDPARPDPGNSAHTATSIAG